MLSSSYPHSHKDALSSEESFHAVFDIVTDDAGL